MQQRRSQSPRARARTATAPSPAAAVTAPAEIIYFPKGRARAKTLTDLPAAMGEVQTDPTGEVTRRALEEDRRAHARADAERRAAGHRDVLAYQRRKLEPVLRGDAEALAGMSQRERMEVATLGHSLYEQGRLQEARIVFEGLVALEPREAFPYTVLGAIFLSTGDAQRALALFEAALGIDADDAAALCYRGEIRLQLGQRARGLADLRRAAEVDAPGSPFGIRARAALSEALPVQRP